ncbi:MAG: hypothetical protein ABI263_02805 [Gelidibacter sp.]
MPEHIDHDNFGDEGFALETREARLIADHKSKEAERKALLETPMVKEKSFAERMKTNRFWLVRGIYYVFYSVWAVVMGIGIVIAWLIAMLFI